MPYVAIETRYLPATDHRPARVKATSMIDLGRGTASATVPWWTDDEELTQSTIEARHYEAALQVFRQTQYWPASQQVPNPFAEKDDQSSPWRMIAGVTVWGYVFVLERRLP